MNSLEERQKILVVDDSKFNQELIMEILGEEYQYVLANDGLEAISILQKDWTIDLMLLDINMPRMDGYEATKEIRKLSADVPIIAITAFAYASDEQRVLENGFDGYMSKPINAPLLKQQIASILQKRIIFL